MYLVNTENKVYCQCTTKHVPKPTQYFYVELHGNRIVLCPTTAMNLDKLLLEYKRYSGEVPGEILKHYSKFVRGLARDLAVW